MTFELIPVSKLIAHPDNPRLFMREEVVSAICEQIKANDGKYEERHAVHVRAVNGSYQIISGHQRTEGAKRAGVKKLPCVVVEMSDEDAFRELLLSNAQGELKPLEIGLHVLKSVARAKGGRGKKGGISEYAEKMGSTQQTVSEWVCAARVANKATAQAVSLIEYEKSLSIIHRAPESDWTDLVERMLSGHWTTDQTERYVEVVKALEVPEEYRDIFPRPVLIARFFEKHEFSPSTLAGIITAIQRTEDVIRSYASVIDAESYVAAFRAWLRENGTEALDVRRITKRQRELLAEFETAEREHTQRWNSGNWREFIPAIENGSVALVLTDPPYGMDYQSNRMIAREGYEVIVNDGRAESAAAETEESLRALYPKLRDDAHILCFCHWRTESVIRDAIVRAGYEIRGSLIWVKDQYGPGDLKGSFAPKHERIIHAVKGSPILFQREADVLEFPRITAKNVHPAEKPVELLARLIEATTVEGDTVADPFAGVASTLVAAKRNKRLYWGSEIVPEYFREGEKRIAAED